MIVKNIKLENFRNYGTAYAEFADNVNVIIGDNAQGKTNLLEAVFYLTTARSFRSRSDREIINFGKDAAFIDALVEAGDREHRIEIRFRSGYRRKITVNGVGIRSAAELSQKGTAILFCADDMNIIKEGPAARRKLMDVSLCQLRPRYASALAEFNRVYERKTRILKDNKEKPSLLEPLDEYNYRLAQMSAELIYYRARFVQSVAREAAKIHSEFSGGRETLSVEYRTIKTVPDPLQKPSELLPYILEHQKTHRQAEIKSGTCLSGAHKDDLEIEINGKPARSFASQGQARTAALSIKLAERKVHCNDRGEYPILLLDDVLSELDPGRQSFVLNKICDGQVFITCCEDGQVAEKTGGRILRVTDGEITLDAGMAQYAEE